MNYSEALAANEVTDFQADDTWPGVRNPGATDQADIAWRWSSVLAGLAIATLAAGTIATSKPLTHSQVWNDGGAGTEVFTGVKLDYTLTSGAATSKPLDIHVGGASVFAVQADGTLTTQGALDLGLDLSGTDATASMAINATWNTTGTPTLIFADVTDTASDAASLLMDLQVGSTSQFKVDKSGNIIIPGGGGRGLFSSGLWFNLGISSSTAVARVGSNFFRISSGNLQFSSDVIVERDAADTLALRRTTNAQTFRIYNTYTDASNYERGFIGFVSNTLTLGYEKAGTGSNRSVEITAGSNFGNIIFSGSADYAILDDTDLSLGAQDLLLRASASAQKAVGDAGIRASAANVLRILGTDGANTGALELGAVATASLPGTPAAGMIAHVNDANAPSIGSTLSGGGAAAALVWYNGSNWTVIGV